MRPLVLSILLSMSSLLSYGQTTLEVTDQTIKIPAMKTETLEFGFAEGDQIVLSFFEVDGKELKSLEVIEYPSTIKYSDFKTYAIENKTIQVNKKAVYHFKFSNESVTGKVCKIKIQRIPASEQTRNFNTNVTWEPKQDTTWNTYTRNVIVGYDTTYHQQTKKEVLKTEISEVLLLEKNQRVHTSMNSYGDKSYVSFTLPASVSEAYKTSKVIGWAYWIGVGQESAEVWNEQISSIGGIVEGVASMYTSPLGAYLLGEITTLLIPKNGDNVFYALTDHDNKNLFLADQVFNAFDKGEGMGGYKKIVDADMCNGTFYIVLYNDNSIDAIDVNVKVSSIVETTTYEDRVHMEQKISPRYESKIFKEPFIETNTVPVFGM